MKYAFQVLTIQYEYTQCQQGYQYKQENEDEGEVTADDVCITNFKCPKCGKVFSKEDNLNYPKEKGHKWCSLFTILSYGEQEYGPVQP